MTKTSLVRLITLLLAFVMVVTMVTGCKKDDKDALSDSSDSVLYDPDFDSDEDDDVLVDEGGDVITGGGSKTVKKTKKGSSGSGTLATGEKVNEYKIDEKATKSFFESVPASLKGTTVKHLIWWAPGKAESKKAEIFKAKTGITIKFINCGVGQHNTKLASMIGQGNSPDLAPFIQNDYPTSLINNYFQPLTVSKAIDLTDPMYDIQTMKDYTWNGKMYGAMVKSSTMITFYPIFYNVKMFNENGIKTPTALWKEGNWNWDTLLSTCAQFKTKGFATPLAGDYGCVYIHNSGGEDCVKISNGKISNNCGSAKVLAGWKFFAQLSDTYKYVCNDGQFYAKAAPMCLRGNYIAQTGDVLDQQVDFEWDVVPTPCPAGQSFVLPGELKMWGFPRGAKNVEGAAYWLRYWLDATMDDASVPTWTTTNSGTLTLMSWMWDQPKALFNYRSVVNYGGSYSSETMDAEFGATNEANVKTVLDKWSGVITTNINALNKLG